MRRADLIFTMRVAALQCTTTADVSENVDQATRLIAQAAEAGASVVVLPEYFAVAGTPDVFRGAAEPLDGPLMTWAAGEARRHQITLVAGTFPERPSADPFWAEQDTDAAPGPRRIANTCCTFAPSGDRLATYRKMHLFDVDVPGVRATESALFRPGRTTEVAPVATATNPVGLGLAVCFDLRFPDLFSELVRDGATVVALPAAFTAVTGSAHWEVLIRARAVDHQLFVIAAAQVGPLPKGQPVTHGHSMIVDPWGTILAERSDPSPGVVVADLDLQEVERVRRALPVGNPTAPNSGAEGLG